MIAVSSTTELPGFRDVTTKPAPPFGFLPPLTETYGQPDNRQ